MGEGSSLQDSGSDSIMSKSSIDMLIAKSPQNGHKKKESKKHCYNHLDSAAEVQKDSFKWIPNPSESILNRIEERNKTKLSLEKELTEEYLKTKQEGMYFEKEKRMGIVSDPDTSISTLYSEKTSSNSSSSEFTSNTYNKNGYIKASNGKRNSVSAQSLLKYNEFNSLGSSIGAYPVELKVENDKDKIHVENVFKHDVLRREHVRVDRHDENTVFLITGGIQMMLGILMAVFGVLVIVHDASLAGAGGGLWGGAVALLSGLFGVLAGLKGCYSTAKRITETRVSPALLTAYLALCLVSFALSNLVLVLTATGLFRDVQRPRFVETENDDEELTEMIQTNWAPILSNSGLIVASGIQCVIAVISGYKCYKRICPCLRKDGNTRMVDNNASKYKTEGKETFVNHWLGQQFTLPSSNKRKRTASSSQQQWAQPNIVLLPHPPPPMIANGQLPILTFLQAPPALLSSPNSHLFTAPPSSSHSHCCCGHHHHHVTPPTIHKPNYILPDQVGPRRKKSRPREKKREKRISLPTAEEVAKTYTGLDREIAEEFIAISMDKSRKRNRSNSVGEYNVVITEAN